MSGRGKRRIFTSGHAEALEIEQLAAIEWVAAGDVPDRQAELAHDGDQGIVTRQSAIAFDLLEVPGADHGVPLHETHGAQKQVMPSPTGTPLGDLESALVLAAAALLQVESHRLEVGMGVRIVQRRAQGGFEDQGGGLAEGSGDKLQLRILTNPLSPRAPWIDSSPLCPPVPPPIFTRTLPAGRSMSS